MAFGNILSGFSNRMVQDIVAEREARRKAEDADIDYQMEIINNLTKNPNINPNILNRAIADLAALHQAKTPGARKSKGSMYGGSEMPISQLIQSIASGAMPMQGPTTEQVPRPIGQQIEMTRGAELGPLDPQSMPQIRPGLLNQSIGNDLPSQGGITGRLPMDTVVPSAPVGPPPAITPLQRAAKQAEMQTQLLPPERQPLLRSPDEIAAEEGQAAGVRAGAIAKAQRKAGLEAWVESGGDPQKYMAAELEKMSGRPTAASRTDVVDAGYFDIGGKTIKGVRVVKPDGTYELQEETSRLPIPPGTPSTSAPKAEGAEHVGTPDQQALEAFIAAAEAKAGHPLSPQEKSDAIEQWQAADANRKRPVTNINAGTNQLFNRTDKIRDDFRAEPITKRYNVVQDAVNFIQNLDVNTVNPADDQALLYAFAKAMDPDSVVREGEYQTVQRYAQSWADTYGFNVARIFSNSPFLTPQARMNMKATILQRAIPVKTQYEALRRTYSDVMRRAGGTDADLQMYTAETPVTNKSLNDYRKTAVPAPPIAPMPSHR